ncbi:MAG: glutamyl-tRNA amidotransferase [Chloroflexi bacterium]|nr:MAG: glutamyl-tRNA amidotransferase [Chloroflexota bacterium]
MTDKTLTLVERIDADLTQAMRQKDETAKQALRAAKTALTEARTATENRPLTDAEAVTVLQKLAKRRRDTAAEYEKLGAHDRAQAELADVAIFERYLPQALSEAEVETIARQVIAETGATSARELGRVMGPVIAQVAGRADGRLVSQVVRRLLGG